MTLTRRPRLALFAALAVLMAATRLNHFGAVPDASWAVFLLAGFYLAGSVRWAFPALMVLAVAVDYVVITGAGRGFCAGQDLSDPAIAPGVGTTVPGGPNYREAQLVMEMIADTGRLASLDIVELNPALDVRNRTAELAVDLVESLFGKSTLMRSGAPRA